MFDDFELSLRGGKPRQLFQFTRQAKAWRYAGVTRDVVIAGKTYVAAGISRSEIKLTAESPQDKITITLPYTRNPNAAELPPTQELGDMCYPYVPQDRISVMCLDYHANDPDLQAVVRWQGRVAQPKYNANSSTLELTCVRNGSSDKNRRRGPKWQKTCWKTVYSTGLRGCNLIAEAIPVQGTLTAISGNDVTAAEWVPQQRTYVGGVATWDDAGTPRSATIIAANGGTLTLSDVTGLAVGSAVTASTTSLITIGTLTAINGLVLTAAEFADAPFSLNGGTFSWTCADGIVEERPIVAHTKGSTDVTLLYGGNDLAAGLAVSVLPNCPGTWDACDARGNTIHYGGSLYEPIESPYDGQSMSWG